MSMPWTNRHGTLFLFVPRSNHDTSAGTGRTTDMRPEQSIHGSPHLSGVSTDHPWKPRGSCALVGRLLIIVRMVVAVGLPRTVDGYGLSKIRAIVSGFASSACSWNRPRMNVFRDHEMAPQIDGGAEDGYADEVIGGSSGDVYREQRVKRQSPRGAPSTTPRPHDPNRYAPSMPKLTGQAAE